MLPLLQSVSCSSSSKLTEELIKKIEKCIGYFLTVVTKRGPQNQLKGGFILYSHFKGTVLQDGEVIVGEA